MKINLIYFIILPFILFIFGIVGIITNRKNVLLVLLAIELMLLAVNLNLVFFSVMLDDLFGQVFAMYVLTVAAAESAVGLAILVSFYRIQQTLSIKSINLLQG